LLLPLGLGLLEKLVVRTYYEAQGKPVYAVREMLAVQEEGHADD
jgi:hypothetical protein